MIKFSVYFPLFLCFVPLTAHAYVGFGPLIPIVGSAIVYIVGILIVLFGLVFYPFKVFFTKLWRIKAHNKIDEKAVEDDDKNLDIKN